MLGELHVMFVVNINYITVNYVQVAALSQIQLT